MAEEIVKAKKEKTKNRYIFPNWLAKKMRDVSFRTQMESSLLSMSLLLIGMLLVALYILLYGGQTLYFKILLVINMLCGVFFMGSYLITTYQQYKSYMDTMGFDTDHEKAAIKAKGNIFKRIANAWRERKKARKAKETIANIGDLLEKSGMAKETSPEEKQLDEEIDGYIKESLGEKDKEK
jgi:membrane protein required for beta-lactamase induction